MNFKYSKTLMQPLNQLAKICSLGTSEFREWYLDEFEKRLSPIEFNSLDKYKKL